MAEQQQSWEGFERGNAYHRILGVTVEGSGTDWARVKLPSGENVRGGVHGSFHGGVLSALADIACLAAMHGQFSEGVRPNGTAELNISYLRPALGEYVVAEARILKRGRTLAVIDVDICGPDGRLVAKSRVSYALRTLESGG